MTASVITVPPTYERFMDAIEHTMAGSWKSAFNPDNYVRQTLNILQQTFDMTTSMHSYGDRFLPTSINMTNRRAYKRLGRFAYHLDPSSQEDWPVDKIHGLAVSRGLSGISIGQNRAHLADGWQGSGEAPVISSERFGKVKAAINITLEPGEPFVEEVDGITVVNYASGNEAFEALTVALRSA